MDEDINSSEENLKETDFQDDGINKLDEGYLPDSAENEISKKEKIIQKIKDTKKQRRTLLLENCVLQQKLSSLFKGPLREDFRQDNEMPPSTEKQAFLNLLNLIDIKLEEEHALELNSNKEINYLKNTILQTEIKYKKLNDEFMSLKEKAAYQSVNSNTGEKFSKKEVHEFLQKEQEADVKLQFYQLEYIRKKYDLQEALQKKQNLVEGPVNYAEYDVMCTEIENNIEVTKQLQEETEELQQKMFSMINIISHLSQKLQFVQYQKEIFEAKEKSLEEELNKIRDSLFEEKMKFNKKKERNEDLRHRFILLQHPKLLEDYKNLKIENEKTKEEIQQLKDAYSNSMKIVTELQK